EELEAQLPVDPPKPAGTIDIHLMSSILLDKMEEMGDPFVTPALADTDNKVYNKEEVKKYLGLDETDKITYVSQEMDCDDFAAILFGKFAGLVWTKKHALNWFIDETETLWFIEPQTDKMSKNLEGWQGWNVRFFISR
ncbi:hypothetical protein LCGC14_1946820, partial [marine sediment metagenome]